MNISNPRESDLTPKQESTNDGTKINPKPNLTTSSWTKLKDPRIVRVSRAFGGKDRHSKVCTVRGLRDRRVRLSVPTAIQLYDLQDRLGLSQPSKVVDWLLDVAKHEIDELPPLQMPTANFIQAPLQPEGAKRDTNSINWESYWNSDKTDTSQLRGKNHYHHPSAFVQPSDQFTSPQGVFSSFLKWDPANLSLSQFRGFGTMGAYQQYDTLHNFNVYPPPAHDHKQLNFEMLTSSSSSHNPFSSPLDTINQVGMRLFSSEHEQSKGN